MQNYKVSMQLLHNWTNYIFSKTWRSLEQLFEKQPKHDVSDETAAYLVLLHDFT